MKRISCSFYYSLVVRKQTDAVVVFASEKILDFDVAGFAERIAELMIGEISIAGEGCTGKTGFEEKLCSRFLSSERFSI